MKLNLQGIADKSQWEAKGYQLPQYLSLIHISEPTRPY